LEPLTHFLTGACISRAAGLNRKTALATATCVLAAEAADLDVFGYLRGPIYGFAHHRGITHSFVGVPLVAGLVLGFVYLVWRMQRRWQPEPSGCPAGPPAAAGAARAPRWGLLYSFACLAALSHILLDYTNSYGVRPFEPFSYKWYSWDIVFIFEPVLYIIFFAGLALPSLFGLINEEIGVRRRGPRGRAGAVVALVLMVALWGLRDYQHRRAVAALEARLYHRAEPLRVSAYPYYFNPFKWYGVVETETLYDRVIVNSLTPEVDPEGRAQTRFKREETEVTEAAKDSYLGHVYLDWAQYPVTEVERLGPPSPGYLVRFYDLRFDYPDQRRRRGVTLGARVLLNDRLQPVAEYFGMRTQRPDLTGPQENGEASK
jgi:inner membrane protein